MSRIYRYILVHDAGMAPCVEDGLVTLATCKPRLRASARPGDWVLGFRPAPAPRGLLVWAGRVAAIDDWAAYQRAYPGRRDAVYRGTSGGGFARLRPEYHPGAQEMARDLSAPVLRFDPGAAWHFGADPRLLPEPLAHLAAQGRGHRVHGDVPGDAARLEAWLRAAGTGLFSPSGNDFAPRAKGKC